MKTTLKDAAGKTISATRDAASNVIGQVGRVGRLFGSVLLKTAVPSHVTVTHPAAPGSSPGIESVGDIDQPPTPGSISIQAIDYGPSEVRSTQISDRLDWLDRPAAQGAVVRWLNVDGLHPWVVDQLRRRFHIHTLAAEDVLRVPQRPKIEEYDNGFFIVVRMIRIEDEGLHSEQVSIFLFKDAVLTFQEQPGDVWQPIRARLQRESSRIRSQGTSYLVYALLDAVVDHCFPILEQFGDQLEALEREVMEDAKPTTQQRILGAKRDLAMLRRILWPLRDITSTLQADENVEIPDEVKTFLRDVHDHTVQLLEMLESYREMAGGLNDLYMSVVSNRMNEVMKVLTIMASFFIPITFVAGVYGMNFAHIPELQWKYGYLVFWGACVSIVLALLIYFYRKGWIGGR